MRVGFDLMLQSHKGLSSVRLATKDLGVEPTDGLALGHALRLMVARENMLVGTVEIAPFP